MIKHDDLQFVACLHQNIALFRRSEQQFTLHYWSIYPVYCV